MPRAIRSSFHPWVPMRLAILLPALCLFGACSRHGGSADVPHLTLVEDFRIGGADTGMASFTGIHALSFDASGQIWLVDQAAPEIRIFSPEGRYQRSIGREGVGPGEFRTMIGLGFVPGGLVWLADWKADRYSLFDTAGRFVTTHSDLHLEYGYFWEGGVDSKGRLYDRISVGSDTSPRQVLRRFRDTSLTQADTLPAPSCTKTAPRRYKLVAKNGYSILLVPFDVNEVGTFDPAGNYWCSDGTSAGAIEIGVDRGDTLATIRYDRARLPVSPTARDSAIEKITARAREMGSPLPDFSLIPEIQPAVISIKIDDSGRLWLRTPTTSGTLYDLFDREGRRLAEVSMPLVVNRYWPLAIRGDTVLAVTLDDDDVPTIVRLHLAPVPK